jgi:hypothetical protein
MPWRSIEILHVILSYLWLHSLAFAGAIRFRNFALARTAAFAFACLTLLGLVGLLAVRILYRDIFTGFLQPTGTIHAALLAQVQPWQLTAASSILALWVLYLGWLYLGDHEVQDGL